MPALVPLPILDGNGDGIVDGTAVDIEEAAVQVLIVAGGVILAPFVGGSAAEGIAVMQTIRELMHAIFGWDDTGSEPTMADRLDAIQNGTDQLVSPNGTTYQRVKTVADWVASDPLAGLTLEWPTEAPSWYTSVSGEAIAGEVWSSTTQFPTELDFYQEYSYGQMVQMAAQSAYQRSKLTGTPIAGNPDFSYLASPEIIAGIIDDSEMNEPLFELPDRIDWSGLLADDTLQSFLQRTQSSFTWTLVQPHRSYGPGNVGYIASAGGNQVAVVCNVTPGMFDLVKAAMFPPEDTTPAEISLPPVLDAARFTRVDGTPIPFTAPFVYTGACDGVTFVTSTQGGGVKGFQVEDHRALTGAGVIGFFGDDGLPEKFQYINWDTGILVPMTMAHAAGFVWSSNVSLSGTVTPFTLEPIT